MDKKINKILFAFLLASSINTAMAALVGVEQQDPSAQIAVTNVPPPPPSGPSVTVSEKTGGNNKSGTPTQAGNASAVSSILHPVPKEQKAVVYEIPEPMTEEQTEAYIMDDSINAYPGPCACPYSRNSDGFECGVEAAYYKPGGFRIYCYPEDLRGQQSIFYRKTH
ncbi:MAG: hypothetical protein JSS07_10955 [Proteobacteria bacterium]|nr:hypothetical protein [Pseudomonadota bacterium]